MYRESERERGERDFVLGTIYNIHNLYYSTTNIFTKICTSMFTNTRVYEAWRGALAVPRLLLATLRKHVRKHAPVNMFVQTLDMM